MKCPKCGNLMPLSVMPKNGKTLVKCGNCGDRTLYADDYDMGGG
jgi:transcription elongation factor Elf1